MIADLIGTADVSASGLNGLTNEQVRILYLLFLLHKHLTLLSLLHIASVTSTTGDISLEVKL